MIFTTNLAIHLSNQEDTEYECECKYIIIIELVDENQPGTRR